MKRSELIQQIQQRVEQFETDVLRASSTRLNREPLRMEIKARDRSIGHCKAITDLDQLVAWIHETYCDYQWAWFFFGDLEDE